MKPTLENYAEWEENISRVSRSGLYSNLFHYHAITTPHGFVIAWVVNEKKWQTTKLEFVHNGTKYHRRWDAQWGEKTITRIAREFAEDVIAKAGES